MAEIGVRRGGGTSPVDWRAAIGAGIVAGAVFLILEMMMVPVFLGGSAWGPPRMIAAIVLGQSVLPPPATFDLGILMAAMVVHFALSILFAVILAAVVTRVGYAAALAVGVGFGLLLYVVNFYGMTAIFPWFANARNWVGIVAHALFGLIAAWWYEVRARRPDPVRAG